MTATDIALKVYKVKGTSRDVVECERCGRQELQGTVIMRTLNEAGEEYGDAMYFGVQCAAKLARATQGNIRKQAGAADRLRVQDACQQETNAWSRRRIAWMASTGGSARDFERVERCPSITDVLAKMGLTA